MPHMGVFVQVFSAICQVKLALLIFILSVGVISPEMLQEMQNGDAVLPLSDHFPMPKLVRPTSQMLEQHGTC